MTGMTGITGMARDDWDYYGKLRMTGKSRDDYG